MIKMIHPSGIPREMFDLEASCLLKQIAFKMEFRILCHTEVALFAHNFDQTVAAVNKDTETLVLPIPSSLS